MKGLARDGQGPARGREDPREEAQERALPLPAFPPEEYRFPGVEAQAELAEDGRCFAGPAKA